jgi:hypothetical protein
MNIFEAMADPNVFAPHFKGLSWKPWKAALAAIFALPMDDEALAIYRACTGRSEAPMAPFTEAALCVGRKAPDAGGFDSRCNASDINML